MKHQTDLDVPFADAEELGAVPAPYRLTQPGYISDPTHYAVGAIHPQQPSGGFLHRLLHYFSRCEHKIAPPWRLVLRDDCGHWEEKPGVHLRCCICGLETIRRYDPTVDPTLKFRALGW